MNKLLIGLTFLVSMSSFATGGVSKCEADLFEKIYNMEEIQTKLSRLIVVPDSDTIQRDLTKEEVRSMRIENSITISIGRIVSNVCNRN